MSILTVGSGAQYSTISAAVAASQAGDTVDVNAGTYTNDFPTISHSLTLQAVGGTASLVATQAPSNGKGIIDAGGSGTNVTITGFDISGAQVPDGNGAGVRYEGGNLTLSGDTIHDNQDGLLSNADPSGTITVSNSTFANNGSGTGGTHNIYVGDVASLTVQDSTITGAVVGHEIKSRAESTTITGNTITDGATGTASYEIDLPNGGNAVVTGNVIEKGPNAQNPVAISFGEEGSVYGNSSLTVQGNTMLNDYTAHSTTGVVNDTGATASVTGNSLYGWSTVASGPASVSGNTTLNSEPALSSLSPSGSASAAATGTSTTVTSTPATASSGTSATTAGTTTSTDTANMSTGTTSATSQDGNVPISTATVGSSPTSPTFIAGDTSGSQDTASGTASTAQASSDTSGTGSVASLAAAPLDPVQASSFMTGSGWAEHWGKHVQAGGSAAQMLTGSFGQHADHALPPHAGGLLA
jgi:hypothetical protein